MGRVFVVLKWLSVVDKLSSVSLKKHGGEMEDVENNNVDNRKVFI